MGMRTYLEHVTPPQRPIPGREADMVANRAGGFTFRVTPWEQLDRWLILGSERGTYHATPAETTVENLDVLRACLDEDGPRTVARIVEVSVSGRAPKNDQAVLALAVAARHPNREVRRLACELQPHVCRTGSQHIDWVAAAKRLGGAKPGDEGLVRSERMLRRALGRWYEVRRGEDGQFEERPVDNLAYQLVKYRSRGGTWREQPKKARRTDSRGRSSSRTAGGRLREQSWTHADILRLARPKGERKALAALASSGLEGAELAAAEDAVRRRHAILRWTLGKATETDRALLPPIITAYEALPSAPTPEGAARVIRAARLPHEAVPDQFRREPAVWEALLQSMPTWATLRWLPTLTRVGVLAPGSRWSTVVARRLVDPVGLRKSRLHPMALLLALRTYQTGRSVRGDTTWTPNAEITSALDAGFYAAFAGVEPTGKRLVVGVDVSPSMRGRGLVGYGLRCPNVITPAGEIDMQPREAAAAMALVLARTEPNVEFVAFDQGWQDLAIRPDMSIADLLRETAKLRSNGTDCAVPLRWAREHGARPDAVILLTDNETWAGYSHPVQELEILRASTGNPVRLVSCAFAPIEHTVADPQDALQLNCVGLDGDLPNVIASFLRED